MYHDLQLVDLLIYTRFTDLHSIYWFPVDFFYFLDLLEIFWI